MKTKDVSKRDDSELHSKHDEEGTTHTRRRPAKQVCPGRPSTNQLASAECQTNGSGRVHFVVDAFSNYQIFHTPAIVRVLVV